MHVSNKKDPPPLPGRQDWSGRFRSGLWRQPLSQFLFLEITSLVVKLDQVKNQSTCMACPWNENLILWAILDRNYSPSFDITLSWKVTVSPGNTDRSFRHQVNLMPATARIYCLGKLELCLSMSSQTRELSQLQSSNLHYSLCSVQIKNPRWLQGTHPNKQIYWGIVNLVR